MTKPNSTVDWERIEADYRLGILSIREIAAIQKNITDTAIRKRAKRDGWERDLSGKVKAKTEALVRASLVRKEVRAANQKNEKYVVEDAAIATAGVLIRQRTHIQRAHSIAVKLLDEMETMTGNFAGRVDGIRKLSETMKTLVGLERQAFGISEDPDAGRAPVTIQASSHDERI